MSGPPSSRSILYIAGAGRSGSTLIEMILGNLPGFFSVGEIRFFWEYMTGQDMLCGCGERLESCPVWATIAAEVRDNRGINLGEIARLAAHLDRTRQAILMNSVLDPYRVERRRLIHATSQLYDAVFERSGARVLVDSSKTPTHLRLLAETDYRDIRILHLIRDGRAVAYSWSRRVKRELAREDSRARMPSHSALRSIIVWMFENAWAARMKQDFPYIAMRYEDFASHPQAELQRAMAALDLSADLVLLDQLPVRLSPTHSVGGNPIRFSPHGFLIKPDEEWRRGLSKSSYLALSVLGFIMLRNYGYMGRG